MKRVIAAFLILITLFPFASCKSSYMVEGEKDALKVYSCPGDNMLGLEKMVIFKDRVVTVFDKKIMNSSRYAFKAEEMSKTGSFHAFASLTGNLNYECKAGLYIDGGKYIVLCYFTYNGDNNILDPSKGITVDYLNIEDRIIYLNDGSFKLCYSETVPDAYLNYIQDYNAGTKSWGRIRQSASSAEDMPGA